MKEILKIFSFKIDFKTFSYPVIHSRYNWWFKKKLWGYIHIDWPYYNWKFNPRKVYLFMKDKI